MPDEPVDDIRPKGTVQVPCSTCPVGDEGERWYFWVLCDDPRLPNGPFRCPTCVNGPGPILKERER